MPTPAIDDGKCSAWRLSHPVRVGPEPTFRSAQQALRRGAFPEIVVGRRLVDVRCGSKADAAHVPLRGSRTSAPANSRVDKDVSGAPLAFQCSGASNQPKPMIGGQNPEGPVYNVAEKCDI